MICKKNQKIIIINYREILLRMWRNVFPYIPSALFLLELVIVIKYDGDKPFIFSVLWFNYTTYCDYLPVFTKQVNTVIIYLFKY